MGKQRSKKHTHKTKDRVTRNPLKTGDKLRWPESVDANKESTEPRLLLELKSSLRNYYGRHLFDSYGISAVS
jgi:hypothetical protein